MAGMFGADFQSSQPSDSDLVKRGAAVFRDIKTRIKAFMGVCFNLETGQPKEKVFPQTSIKDKTPDPSGTWNEVDVDQKGFVTAGRTVNLTSPAKPYRFVYNYTSGTDADGDTITRSLDTDDDGLNVATYTFTVPDGVERLRVQCFGAGGGGGYNATPLTAGGGGGGGYCDTLVDVTEGDAFLVWVGEGGGGMDTSSNPGENGAETKFAFSDVRYAAAHGGFAGTATEGGAGGESEVTSAFEGWGPNFDFRGEFGSVSQFGGGSGGGGATGFFGRGGDPSSSVDGSQGSSGLVIVDYWLLFLNGQNPCQRRVG